MEMIWQMWAIDKNKDPNTWITFLSSVYIWSCVNIAKREKGDLCDWPLLIALNNSNQAELGDYRNRVGSWKFDWNPVECRVGRKDSFNYVFLHL